MKRRIKKVRMYVSFALLFSLLFMQMEIQSTTAEDKPSAAEGKNSSTGKFIESIIHQEAVPDDYTGIFTVEDLNNVRNDLTGNYIMMNDIDLSSWGDWTPIGDSESSFSGNFDGNGYTVKNLNLGNETGDYQGLFGYVTGADIKNIGIVDCNITGNNFVGSIAGYVRDDSNIQNCYNTGTINGINRVGGLVGGIGWDPMSQSTMNGQSASIQSCYNSGSISGEVNVGGIAGTTVGLNGAFDRVLVDITNCENAGDISLTVPTGDYAGGVSEGGVGGIAGRIIFSNVENCSNRGEITAYITVNNHGYTIGSSYTGGIVGESSDQSNIIKCSNTGIINGFGGVGGIAGSLGYVRYNDGNQIYKCTNSAPITGRDLVGGIAGNSNHGGDNISSNYNTGNISGESIVGGIVGNISISEDSRQLNRTTMVKDCYNTGNVNATGVNYDNYFTDGSYCGGITAEFSEGTIQNCYNSGRVKGSGVVRNTDIVGGEFIGGIAGVAYSYDFYCDATILNCASISSDISGNNFVGVILGGMYKTETDGYPVTTDNIAVDSGEYVSATYSASEFYNKTVYESIGWDFETVWTMPEDGGYPILQWQRESEEPDDDLTDTDGDGLPDKWEEYGVDINNDGIIDLPLDEMGADPNKPDIFVEIDWMVRPKSGIFWWAKTEKTFSPSEESMKLVYDAFANQGINLHIDAGPDSVDFVTDKKWGELSGGNKIPYTEEFKVVDSSPYSENMGEMLRNNFAKDDVVSKARERVFKYAVFVDHYSELKNGEWESSGSGISFSEITEKELAASVESKDTPLFGRGGQYFLVAQGWLDKNGYNSEIATAGTFMHELGHTLGLGHGGCDADNYKPNYLSIMNYPFQTSGLISDNDQTNIIDYSNYKLPDLDENNLVEINGIDPAGLTDGTGLCTKIWNSPKPVGPIARHAVDFDGDGKLSLTNVKVNINKSVIKRLIFKEEKNGDYDAENDAYVAIKKVLAGFNDWENLVYEGGSIGGKGSDISAEDREYYSPKEMSLEEALAVGIVGDGSVTFDEHKIIANQPDQNIFLKVNNLSGEAVSFTLKVKSDYLVDDFQQEVHVEPSIDTTSFTVVPIPVISDPDAGTYSVTCTLSYPDRKDITKEIEVEVYAPSEQELSELQDAIDNGTTGLPDYIVSQYQDVIDRIKTKQDASIIKDNDNDNKDKDNDNSLQSNDITATETPSTGDYINFKLWMVSLSSLILISVSYARWLKKRRKW